MYFIAVQAFLALLLLAPLYHFLECVSILIFDFDMRALGGGATKDLWSGHRLRHSIHAMLMKMKLLLG